MLRLLYYTIQISLTFTTHLFYTLLVMPCQHYLSIEWACRLITFLGAPYVIGASVYTRPRWRRRHRKPRRRHSSFHPSHRPRLGRTTLFRRHYYQTGRRCQSTPPLATPSRHNFSKSSPKSRLTAIRRRRATLRRLSYRRSPCPRGRIFPSDNLFEQPCANDTVLSTVDSHNASHSDTQHGTSDPVLPSSYVSHHLQSIDILSHQRTLISVLNNIPTSYRRLTNTDPQYHSILLQARSLQARIFHYDKHFTVPLQDPLVYLSSTSSDLPIIIDTGASCSLTPDPTDFNSPLTKSDVKGLSQVSGEATVVGTGTVTWNIEDLHGVRRPISTKAYYVPSATVRLFSPQVYINDHKNSRLVLTKAGITMTLKCGTTLRFPINPNSNLPFMLTEAIIAKQSPTKRKLHMASFHLGNDPVTSPLARRSVLHRDNYNLHPDEKELLLWHCRFSHADMQRVQTMLSKPHEQRGARRRGELSQQIVVPRVQGASSCHPPKCEACQYAKQSRTTPVNPKHPSSSYEEGALSQGCLEPGEKISCDQYMCSTLGRLGHTLGKEAKTHQLVGGTIFVDHATNYIFHNHQVNLTAASTVRSKHSCEAHFDRLGIKIRRYASDNHPFASKEWTVDCEAQHQDRTLSGVGAQHQNYMERHMQTIFNWARASLLHFVLHWPQQAQDNLWPFAIDYAVHIWNTLPARNIKLSPEELITGTRLSHHRHLQRAHVFGCPVFILDARLQDSGKKIPKWSMRSRRGIYLGVSPFHNSTVHLVLNPATGAITPQYHLVFDDTFSTVFSNGQFDEANWLNLLHLGHEIHPTLLPDSNGRVTMPPDLTPFDAETPPSAPQKDTVAPKPPGVTFGPDTLLPPPSPIPIATEGELSQPQHNDSVVSPPSSPQSPPLSVSEGAIPSAPEGATAPSPEGAPTTPIMSPPSPPSALRRSARLNPPSLRRSTRTNAGRPPQRLGATLASYDAAYSIHRPNISGSKQTVFNSSSTDNLPRIRGERLQHAHITNLHWDKLLNTLSNNLGALSAFIATHQRSLGYTIEGTPLVNYLHPALLQVLANTSESDTPTFTEAMNGPNAAGFLKAMEIEINTLIEMDTFLVVDKQPWMNIISSVWAFKVKRFPDGTVKKLKARFCARGYEQVQGLDYFETFAPVVQWLTVRLILVITIILGLENKQIDYTAAFVQAPIYEEVYVEMPKLFATPGKVWKLKKSIYGLKQSPRNYFLHMKSKLQALGFKQSDADPCLFISPTVICLVYVDDALLVYRDQEAVIDLTNRMAGEGMLFNVESDVAGYLGVLIDRQHDGAIIMRQEGLAKRVVEALHLNDSTISPVKTPVDSFLPIDKEGEPATGLYNYASVVGMLNYLQGHSRIDITFAVSQVARFVHAPKRSHELALERIGRYLKGTLDQGLILRPTPLNSEDPFRMDIYVDAAFACGWGTEEGTNPDSVKSRTGYVIEVMGCSVIWCSKLQTAIATSTMEAEYTALSMALRAAIPLLAVFKAIATGLNLANDRLVTFRATLHEDNIGALTLANLEPGRDTPRSKFYALKLHWFRSWLEPNKIEIIHCPTKDQKADYLTKPLTPALFEANRKLSMGW